MVETTLLIFCDRETTVLEPFCDSAFGGCHYAGSRAPLVNPDICPLKNAAVLEKIGRVYAPLRNLSTVARMGWWVRRAGVPKLDSAHCRNSGNCSNNRRASGLASAS